MLKFESTKTSDLVKRGSSSSIAMARIRWENKDKELNRLPSAVLCAWTAGILDGEANVAILHSGARKRSRGFAIRILVNNSDFRMLKKLLQTWGGSIHKKPLTHEVRKDIYTWAIHARSAYRMLLAIKPYLVTKKEQAILCIRLQDRLGKPAHRNNSIRSDEEYKIRLNLYNQLCILNKTGKIGDIGKQELIKIMEVQ